MTNQSDSNYRRIPQGTVPVVEVHGTSFECGEQLGLCWRALLREAYLRPDQPEDNRPWFERSDTDQARAIDRHAPHFRELYQGMMKGAGIEKSRESTNKPTGETACSSFAMDSCFTVDGDPLAGQNKDTGWGSVFRYIVLKVCSTDGSGPFTLTYPLDLVGYGMSATGLCLFRNGMPGEPGPGFSWTHWALMAKCKQTVKEAVELFKELQVGSRANVLLADGSGGMMDIEMGEQGNRFIESTDGLLAHTNHFVDRPEETSTSDEFSLEQQENSIHRLEVMKKRFVAERGRLTWVSAFHCMSDHENWPESLCRHHNPTIGGMTTASVVAEPAKGRLHVVRGNPCSNPVVTHSMPIWMGQ